MKIKKFTIIIVSAVLIPLAGILLIGIYGIHSYISKTPVLTPAENVSIKADSSIDITRLCSIAKASSARISYAKSVEGSFELISISEDGQSLTTKGGTGKILVTVSATGSNAESREAEITITVTD